MDVAAALPDLRQRRAGRGAHRGQQSWSGDRQLLGSGLRSLAWLRDTQTREGHCSVVAGRRPAGQAEPLTADDQQPIEVAALADALRHRRAGLRRPVVAGRDRPGGGDWFQGDNDAGRADVGPVDRRRLRRPDRERPQPEPGSESTIALISTMQRHRELP